MRRALDHVDPLLPFAEVRSMADVKGAALAQPRFMMALLMALAVTAVLLSAIGVHGLIATSVGSGRLAALASFIPARRILRLDPATTLRGE